VIKINKGKIKSNMRKTSLLLWFKEWLLYISVVWGCVAQQGYLVGHRCNIGEKTAREIFDSKQQQVLDTMRDWPKHTIFKEGVLLHHEGLYKQIFDNQRVVMWDMTTINISQPSYSETPRLTYW
jgi:hypothetical protein